MGRTARACFRASPLILAAITSVGGASAGHAAILSEVLFEPTLMQPPDASLGTAPAYIEVVDLPDHPIDLVVLNAQGSPLRHGLVLQVFTLPASSANRVLAQGSFSPGMLGPTLASRVTSLPTGVTFDLSPSLARSVMLFDGVTGLAPRQLISNQADKLVDKPLLDVLTLGPAASPFHGEPVWDITGVTAGSRLNHVPPGPWSDWIFGVPNAAAAIGPLGYQLNPGLPNQPLNLPEPGGVGALVLLAGAWLTRRRDVPRV